MLGGVLAVARVCSRVYLETCSMASRKKTSFISFEELMLKSSKYFIERGGGEEKVNKRREEGRE